MNRSPSSPENTSGTTLGEVIAASTLGFTAQCPKERLHQPPAFGTFVKIGAPRSNSPAPELLPEIDDPFADPAPPKPLALPEDVSEDTLYAVVTFAETGSIEPGRRAAAYGLTEADLRRQQPQIFDLMATSFDAAHIGYASTGRFRPHLPPCPPRLHAFVSECSPAEVCAVTESPEFLRTLIGLPASPSDELISACLRHACACHNNDFAYLVRIGKQLAVLLRDSPDRLTALLRKLEP